MNPETTCGKKIRFLNRSKNICSCPTCKKYFIDIHNDETHIHPFNTVVTVNKNTSKCTVKNVLYNSQLLKQHA